MKPEAPVPGLLWACVKPEAPVPSEIALQAARIVQWGWFGFQWGACVKPGPPVPVSWRLIWGVLAKRGWFGFQRGCGYETWAAPVF